MPKKYRVPSSPLLIKAQKDRPNPFFQKKKTCTHLDAESQANRPPESKEDILKEGAAEYVRVDAGYPYDSQKYVKVTIDSNNYQYF